MPLLGGVAVYVAAAVGFMAFTGLDVQLRWLIGGGFLVLALGLLDDRVGLRARLRLLLQSLSAAGLIAAGVHFSWFAWAPANYLVSALWLVGIMNAVNCLDCADGVCAGCASIAAAAFFVVALAHGHFAVALMAVALLGACGGFLAFNFPPASIFLGDAGSTLIGFLLGGLAIAGSRGAPPWHQAWIAALPLAVPIWDLFLVHVRRYRAGTRGLRELLESAGRDHLPHRLQAAGLRPRGVAAAVYFITVLLAAPAALLAHSGHGVLAVGVEIALLALLAGESPLLALVSGLRRRRRRVAEDQVSVRLTPGSAVPGPTQPASYAIQEANK